ncbi:uncharacterized protein [Haliotis cracherodii]|uniref:uncharacterized protein n=1 Tax=Haliotis cracherodii TaxID=6455 RepID=UPI0039ECA949
MSKRLNDKTRSDMSGQGSSGDWNGDMTAELWGEVYDLLCLKMKTDDAYAKLRAKGDNLISSNTHHHHHHSSNSNNGCSDHRHRNDGTSFLKPATPAKRRSRKKLSLKISPQEQLTPDVSSAQGVLEQWWEQTPREPTYSPNAPAVTMTTGDLEDHEALKLATLPSMDLDTLPLLEASWSPTSPEDVHVYSSGTPLVCDDNEDDNDVDLDPYGEAQLTPLQRGCRICRHNNMLRYISCNSGQVMCHTCGLELIDCTCSMLTYDRIMTHDDMPITSAEDHILW